MLAISKRILSADARVRKGLTPKAESYKPLMGIQLKGKTIGIVEVGAIGSRVAMIARSFGMYVLLFDPGVLPTRLEQLGKVVELDELLKASDFVSVHAPSETRLDACLGRNISG
jgi:phosphoglycerate dehydrogenase-like enzyme